MIKKRKNSVNKKVKNATPVQIDGILFKSKLEGYVYSRLKEEKLKAEYEPIKFELIPSFQFQDKKIRPMTYTPDFVGNNFIIEAKVGRMMCFLINGSYLCIISN